MAVQKCKSSTFLVKTDHMSHFMYKMEISDQIQKLPEITGSFLSTGLNVKVLISKSRNNFCVASSHTTFVRTKMNLSVSQYSIVCNDLKENRSCLEFCG